MAAVWPVSLPQEPLIQGFARSIIDDTLRSDVDSGPPEARPLYTGNHTRMTIQQLLTSTQRDALLTFYRTTLAHGSLRFKWSHTQTGGVVKEHFFLSMPQIEPVSYDTWRATYELWVFDL